MTLSAAYLAACPIYRRARSTCARDLNVKVEPMSNERFLNSLSNWREGFSGVPHGPMSFSPGGPVFMPPIGGWTQDAIEQGRKQDALMARFARDGQNAFALQTVPVEPIEPLRDDRRWRLWPVFARIVAVGAFLIAVAVLFSVPW